MRLLVIEDYDLLRQSLCQGLREAGFAVDEAADGKIGLWQAGSAQYDVIILDLMLPGMDGLTVLKRLRGQGNATHVLILTARDTTPDRVTGLDAGADDYLVKPFEFAELLARVRALIRRGYQAKDPMLRVADLEIEASRCSASRGGEAIDLTPREFALLQFLALRQNQVVTRTDIWEHVYDFNAESTSNVIDVYIGHLRRKIDRPGLKPLIHTRRGLGYLLGEEP